MIVNVRLILQDIKISNRFGYQKSKICMTGVRVLVVGCGSASWHGKLPMGFELDRNVTLIAIGLKEIMIVYV